MSRAIASSDLSQFPSPAIASSDLVYGRSGDGGGRPGVLPPSRRRTNAEVDLGEFNRVGGLNPPLIASRETTWDPGSSSNLGETGEIQLRYEVAQLSHLMQKCIDSVHQLNGKSYREAVVNGVSCHRNQAQISGEGIAHTKSNESSHPPKGRISPERKQFPHFSSFSGYCFRCGERGHLAKNCRNALVCFECGKLGHRSWQCRSQKSESVVKGEATLNLSPGSTEEVMMKDSKMLFFENTPESRSIEDHMRKCVVIQSEQEFTVDRVLRNFRRLAPNFPWKVAEMAKYKLLVDGPNWWRDKVIRQETAKVEYANLRAYPWNPSFENGLRLKSLWVRVVGFPTKLWSAREFEKLIESFGTILEIDHRTIDRSYLVEANIRIGVCRYEDVPLTRQVVFRNDRGEKCWTDVKFLFEIPGNQQRQNRNKRQRVWVPKEHSPSTSAPPGSAPDQEKEQNNKDEDDLFEEEGDNSQQFSGEAYAELQGTDTVEVSPFEVQETALSLSGKGKGTMPSSYPE